jgi:hypothetical protein
MALLGRIFVIFFAVMLATLAAGIAIAIGLLGPDWYGFSGDFAERTGFWLLVFFASSFTGAVALLPLLIFIVLAESLNLRSALIHAAAGAAILLLGYYGAGFSSRFEDPLERAPPPISRETELAAAAGAVFGLTYWAIAGRRSGAWRGRG